MTLQIVDEILFEDFAEMKGGLNLPERNQKMDLKKSGFPTVPPLC